MIFTFTPVADYIEARTDAEAAFVPALSGPASFVFDLLLSILGLHVASDSIGDFVSSLGSWVKVDKRYQAVFSQLIADGATWTYEQVVKISQDVQPGRA